MTLTVGIDEVGYGPSLGPLVVAAACAAGPLPVGVHIADSKKVFSQAKGIARVARAEDLDAGAELDQDRAAREEGAQDQVAQLAVLHGGPPCQPFSVAGRQQGHADARNMLPEFLRAVTESRPLGGTWALDALWSRLGIGPAMRKLLTGRRLDASAERVLFALVANRALAPSSKLAAARWISER